MKRRSLYQKINVGVITLLMGAGIASISLAQPPPGQDGGPPPGHGGPNRGPRRPAIANIPLSVMKSELNLTADQVTKISQLQQKLEQQRRLTGRGAGGPGGPGGPPDGGQGGPPAGGPGGPPDGGQGGPPDREQMRAAMEKMRSVEEQSNKSIEAVLTQKQMQALPELLKTVDALSVAGMPTAVYGDLKLSSTQKEKIQTIAEATRRKDRATMDEARQNGGDFREVMDAMRESRQKAHTQAMQVLSAEQKQIVAKYLQAHPMAQRGGGFGPPGGGPGGPGGEGPGGPPPGGPDGSGPPQ